MPPKVNLLEARNLGRRRPDGTGWLLDDVSLEVGPGERIATQDPGLYDWNLSWADWVAGSALK